MTTNARPGPSLSDIGATPRRDGRWWIFPSGYRAPVVAGGSGGQGQAGNAGGDASANADQTGGSGNTPSPTPGSTPTAGVGAGVSAPAVGLTQADVDRAARDARADAERQTAEALGVPLDRAREIIAAAQAAEDAQKTEAQRAREAADAERAAAATERAAAAAERRALTTERALIAAQVRGDRSAQAARLVLAELPDNADQAAIAAAVETFAKNTPEWFGESAPPPPPGSDPQGRGPAGGAGGAKTGIERGRERARQAREERERGRPSRADDPFGRIGRRIGA